MVRVVVVDSNPDRDNAVAFRSMSWDEEPLSEAELAAIGARCEAATPGPWKSFIEGRDHWSGDSFIMRGTNESRHEDLFISPASVVDQDFIAAARQDIPRLIREVRRLHSGLQ